jgi:hypothetical protein
VKPTVIACPTTAAPDTEPVAVSPGGGAGAIECGHFGFARPWRNIRYTILRRAKFISFAPTHQS